MSKLQYVWPKEKGRESRGILGRFGDIFSGKGPDIFLQRQGSRTPIKPEEWGNWDSYHDPRMDRIEQSGPFASRGTERYDPYSRKYVRWENNHDWTLGGVDGLGVGAHGIGYPRFTRDERVKMGNMLAQGRRVDPSKMGRDWSWMGPKRFQGDFNSFWQEAHRLGENKREGLPPWLGPNTFMRMSQQSPEQLRSWI